MSRKNVILVAFAVAFAGCHGALTVTASRDYVDKRTSLEPVTNNGAVVGFKVGIHTNDSEVLAAKSYVDNSTPGDYDSVSNAAMSATHKLDKSEYFCPEWEVGATYKGDSTNHVLYRVSYNGRIYRRYFSADEVASTPPPSDNRWTDVTTTFTNNNNQCRAEGFGTIAGGKYSHAEGYRTYAVTDKSIGSTGAHAEGSKARAVGDASHAEGRHTLADMHASHAEGFETHANAQYSHAEGYMSKTYGKATHAEGNGTTAGLESDRDGLTADVSAYAHAEGENTVATGYASHAEGGDRNDAHTTATNKFAHAEGGGTMAYGEGSHSEGGGTTASGKYSHAEGLGTTAAGMYSHAEGSGTTVTSGASGSHAEGYNTKASHTGVHVQGRYAKSAHKNSFIWSGIDATSNESSWYTSNTDGSFNVNPVGGTDGFYIGKTNLTTILDKLKRSFPAPGNYSAVSNAAMNARSATDLGVRGAPQGAGSWFTVNGQIVSWNAEAEAWGNEKLMIDDYGGHYSFFGEDEREFYLDENFSCSINFGTNTYIVIGYTNALAQVSQIPTVPQGVVTTNSNGVIESDIKIQTFPYRDNNLPGNTTLTIGGSGDPFMISNRIVVGSSYCGGSIRLMNGGPNWELPGIVIAGSTDDGGAIKSDAEISLNGTNILPLVFGAAQRTEISATDPTFSNAVLSVGLNIDTNTVAAINALVESGDDLPIGGATSVGAILLAIAAAIAALKRRVDDKASLADLPYELVERGEWEFSGANYNPNVRYTVIVTIDGGGTVFSYNLYGDGTWLDGYSSATNTLNVVNFSTAGVIATKTGIHLLDHAVNAVSVTDTTTLTLPSLVTGKSRDFYLRMTVTGSQGVSFSPSTGITYTGLGNPSKTYSAGTYLLRFTETAENEFCVARPLSASQVFALDSAVDGAQTVATYSGGTTLSLDLKGVMYGSDVPDRAYLVGLRIGSSVTEVYQDAFIGCGSLVNVSMSDSVTVIGEMAFSECTGMTGLELSSSVVEIGRASFGACESLVSVVIPDSVASVGEVAFAYCTKLTDVTVGFGVDSIGPNAFAECSSLERVTFRGKSLDEVRGMTNYPWGITDTGIIKADVAFSDLHYSLVVAEQTGEWQFSGLPNGVTAVMRYAGNNSWEITLSNGDHQSMGAGGENAMSVEFPASEWMEGIATYPVTATRAWALQDRAVNVVTLGSGVTSAAFQFPVITSQTKARDFFVRLIIQGGTPPTISFVESDGVTHVAFDSDDDSWADIEPGVNILMFTDTAR